MAQSRNSEMEGKNISDMDGGKERRAERHPRHQRNILKFPRRIFFSSSPSNGGCEQGDDILLG